MPFADGISKLRDVARARRRDAGDKAGKGLELKY